MTIIASRVCLADLGLLPAKTQEVVSTIRAVPVHDTILLSSVVAELTASRVLITYFAPLDFPWRIASSTYHIQSKPHLPPSVLLSTTYNYSKFTPVQEENRLTA